MFVVHWDPLDVGCAREHLRSYSVRGALLDPRLPTEHQTYRQRCGTAHGCQWIGGLSVIARNSGARLEQHRCVDLVAEQCL